MHREFGGEPIFIVTFPASSLLSLFATLRRCEMGTLLSRSLALLPATETAPRPNLAPNRSEVYETLALLKRRGLPIELGIDILNAAGYWPRVRVFDKSHRSVRASAGETVEKVILLSPNVRGKAVGQAKVIVDSRDQGQSAQRKGRTTQLIDCNRRLVVVPGIPPNEGGINVLVRIGHLASYPELDYARQQSRSSHHSPRISLPRFQYVQLSHHDRLTTLHFRINHFHAICRRFAGIFLVGNESFDDVQVAAGTTV